MNADTQSILTLGILYGLAACALGRAVIQWQQNGPLDWYLQARPSHNLSGAAHYLCREPKNLPQQLFEWFRESNSDPTMLTIMSDITQHMRSNLTDTIFDSLISEPEQCRQEPSTAANATVMDRALCPWEWHLNRQENREPKLISEAKCLCQFSRGQTGAECVPIQREFPVLKRVYCDQGHYHYKRGYETVTVGCHSVMQRIVRSTGQRSLPSVKR